MDPIEVLLCASLSFLYMTQSTEQQVLHSQGGIETETLSMQQLDVLGNEMRELRSIKGHWVEGGSYNKDTDSFGGRKHRLMELLGKQLGVAGTPAATVIRVLGQPDELKGQSIQQMPGPVIVNGHPSNNSVTSSNDYSLIYYWRGKHDYMMIQVNAETECVTSYSWYSALE